jgi:hypothetical protein
MATKRTIRKLFTPCTFKDALAEAECKLSPRPEGADTHVFLRPAEIETWPDLFQPRSLLWNENQLDPEHVKDLETFIGYNGELTDPVLVIRLQAPFAEAGALWVCVDGHHRLKAYSKAKWKKPIRCEWFGGNVREAVDESVRRNAEVKLAMPNKDRYEAAWRRNVTGGWSKEQIRQICSVSSGLVSKQRKVLALYKSNDDHGRQFREKLGMAIEQLSWRTAHMCYMDMEPQDYDEEKEAGQLARNLRRRMHGKLSENPAVTARALMIYDPKLIEPLMSKLQGMLEEERETERDIATTYDDYGLAAAQGPLEPTDQP